MNRIESAGWEPLPFETVRAIDCIEPPDHHPGFWAQLDHALDERGKDDSEVTESRPAFVRRAVALSAVTALLLVSATTVLRQRETAQGVGSVSDPAQADGDLSGGAGASGDSQPDVLAVPDPDGESDARRPGQNAPASVGPSTTAIGASTSITTARQESSTTESPTTTAAPSTDPQSPPPSEREPIRVEAESMEIQTAGDRTADGWNLWSAGHIENQIDLPATGAYRIAVRARAMSRTSSRPEMEVRLDGNLVGSTMVNIGNYRRYTFMVEAGSGPHRVLVAFTNDPNTPEDDVDLLIDYVEIIATG